MAEKAIGFIETFGLTAAIAAADAACKSANVKLLGYEYAKGNGMCTVKVEGDVGACKAAIAAGKRAAEMVQGTHQGTKSVLLKARPADAIIPKMIKHRENVGGDIALAEGYRPKGESRMPVLVSHWKPKEEPKEEETPITLTPEPPVVEDLKEEPSEPAVEAEKAEEAPANEAPVEEAPAEEAPLEEAPAEETSAEEAPAEATVPVEAPVAEETAPVEAPEIEASAEEEPAGEAPKKKTTGTRRSGRSRKKKNPDKE
ncbi:MAG: BMC domain-containing protein [Eubacterium sp.]|nr:BMC domain-containing protein [Eubacterium sp.]